MLFSLIGWCLCLTETTVLLNSVCCSAAAVQSGRNLVWSWGLWSVGRSWVVWVFDRLCCSVGSLRALCGLADWGFPPLWQRLLCVQFHLHLSLLFSCFSIMSKHISFFFLNSKKHRFIDGFDFRFESWLCHLVVVAVFGWLETLVSAERGRAFVGLKSIMFVRRQMSFQQYNHETLYELIFCNNPLIRLSEPECKDEVTAEYCGDVSLWSSSYIWWALTADIDLGSASPCTHIWLQCCHIESPSCGHTCRLSRRLLGSSLGSDFLRHGFH